MKTAPLQAPYSVERVAPQELVFDEKVIGAVLRSKPSSLRSRGVALDGGLAAIRLNGRPILIEATGLVESNETIDFTITVDAARCRAEGDQPHFLAMRAAEVLGIDDLRKPQ